MRKWVLDLIRTEGEVVGEGGGGDRSNILKYHPIFLFPNTYLLIRVKRYRPPPSTPTHQPHVTKTPFTEARFSPSHLSFCQIRSTSSLMVHSTTSFCCWKYTRRQCDKQPKLDVLWRTLKKKGPKFLLTIKNGHINQAGVLKNGTINMRYLKKWYLTVCKVSCSN